MGSGYEAFEVMTTSTLLTIGSLLISQHFWLRPRLSSAAIKHIFEEFESKRKIDTKGPVIAMNLVDSKVYSGIAAKICKYYGSSEELNSSSPGKVKSLVLRSSDQADTEHSTLEYITQLRLLCEAKL